MAADDVVVRVPVPLRFLLPPPDRATGARRLGFDPDATVGHVVQSAGVPLTEVGTLTVDGVASGAASRTAPGCVIDVAEAARPEAPTAGGFLADVGLGALARRLRLLGLDTGYSSRAGDDELVELARAEDRVLLTQDRRLLMRRALTSDGTARGALVRGRRPDEQLADVLDRFAPALAPLTRCTACNGPLDRVPKAEVADRLEPGTRRSYEEFSRCRACGRVYWRGAHSRRIGALVEAARAASTRSRSSR